MLRQLIIGKKIEALRAQLAERQSAAAASMERREALKKREADLVAAVNEVTEETSAEDKATLDAETEKWKTDDEALSKDETENAEARAGLEKQIADLQAELDGLNARATTPVPPAAPPQKEERKGDIYMTRKTFFGMNLQERDAFLARNEVRDFLGRVVSLAGEKRAVSGAELTVPDVMLEVIRENIGEYSKLLSKVRVVAVGGTARENIMGSIPEAVWTEMIANFNELAFALYNVEVDGFAVGGFIPIANSLMKDSRYPALAAEIIRMLGASIGLALDKAILYGTGVKMPLGIVTRLAQSSAPSNYPATARTWEDLHTSNILAVRGGTSEAYTTLDGIALYKGIAAATTAAASKYSNGKKFWAMSEATWQTLVIAAMSINATGAIVTGATKTMPVIGGEVVLLDFIPNGEIIGGYGDRYLLAEREGMFLSQSEHVRFLNRQTVFAGEARYDGLPVVPEAFVAIAIDAGTVTTSASFATDAANPDGADLATLEVGELTLVPSFSAAVTSYTAAAENATETVALSSTATNAAKGATVVQKNGATTVAQDANATLAEGANTLTFTVTYGTTSKAYTVVVTRAAGQ